MRLLLILIMLAAVGCSKGTLEPRTATSDQQQVPGKPPTKHETIEYSWPKEPDGFKGVKFGSTEAEFRRMLGVSTKDCLGPRPHRECSYIMQVGGFKLYVSYNFTSDQLRVVSGMFPANHWADVQDMFINTYGPAFTNQRSNLRTALGGSYFQDRLEWIGKTMVLSLEKYRMNANKHISGTTFGGDESNLYGHFVLSLKSDLDRAIQAKREAVEAQQQANRKALQ